MVKSSRGSGRSLNTPYWPVNFRTGMWAFALQRVTGLILVVYLLLHIWVIASGTLGRGTFDQVLQRLQSPVFIFLDLLLMAAVLYHAFNGVRILLFDLGVGVRSQRPMFWIAFVLTAVLVLGGLVGWWTYILGARLF